MLAGSGNTQRCDGVRAWYFWGILARAPSIEEGIRECKTEGSWGQIWHVKNLK